MTHHRLLIADDDQRQRAELASALVRQAYEVVATDCREDAVAQAIADDVGAVLISIEGRDGLEVCRWLRERSQVGIIAVGSSSRELDAVAALDAGADEYVIRPVSLARLSAQLRAIGRRTASRSGPAGVCHVGSASVDLDTREVTREGAHARLTPKEFELLSCLIRHGNRVVTHRELLASVWGPEYRDHVDYLRVVINQLRRKIERTPSRPAHILTVPWAGYRLRL
jgi:two-component system KDP operon response regulator KdpE